MEWCVGLLVWLGDCILLIGKTIYDALEGASVGGLSRLVCFLIALLFIFAVAHRVLIHTATKQKSASSDKLKIKSPKIRKESVIKFLGLMKISSAALILLVVLTWIAGVYFKDLGVPNKQDFEVSQTTVVVGETKQSSVANLAVEQCPEPDSPSPESQTREALGQMGDFFGGLLNPILAFASFIALLYTIRIQSKQISEAKEAQELTAFESTYSMIMQALSETPKPSRERVGHMNPFQSSGLGSPERLSEEYAKHYRNNEPSIIVFSCMFYDCVKFLSEHRCAKSVHWNILANMLGPMECYYVASLCAYSSANPMDLDSFSKLATKNELFRQARVINGTQVSIGHGDSSIDDRWNRLNPNELGLELDSFRRAH